MTRSRHGGVTTAQARIPAFRNRNSMVVSPAVKLVLRTAEGCRPSECKGHCMQSEVVAVVSGLHHRHRLRISCPPHFLSSPAFLLVDLLLPTAHSFAAYIPVLTPHRTSSARSDITYGNTAEEISALRVTFRAMQASLFLPGPPLFAVPKTTPWLFLPDNPPPSLPDVKNHSSKPEPPVFTGIVRSAQGSR